jgi:ABC-2 type transport system permease protein
MISLRRIWVVVKKEFLQLKRDTATLRMIVMVPIIQLVLFGFAISSDPRHLSTAIICRDNSVITRNIITALANSEYFLITHDINSEQEGAKLLQEGLVTFVITIPENFTRDLIKGLKPTLLIEADASDPIAISGALGVVNNTINSIINRDTYGLVAEIENPSPYNLVIHKLYNPEGISRYNIIPGLVAIVLTMTCVMMTSLSLTKEKEMGTMENLLSMPGKPIEVMIGKIMPYIMIGYIQALIILVSSYFIFKVPILGNLFFLAIGLLIFIICNLALGFALSTASRTQMQAMQSSIIILLPSILLSGFIFPFRGMPEWAQFLGSLLPSTYFIRIIRGIMLKGSNFSEIWPHIWPLCIFMTIVIMITVRIYKKTLD